MEAKDELIHENIDTLRSIIKSWGIPEHDTYFDEKLISAKNWLRNFESHEILYAINIMKRIRFYSDFKIQQLIYEISEKLDEESKPTYYFSLGQSSASSGSQLLYLYHKVLKKSKAFFKQSSFNELLNEDVNLVFVDDIISSGHQACNFYNKYLTNRKAQCIYIALIGYEQGITLLRDYQCFDQIIAGEILRNSAHVFSTNSNEFTNNKEAIKKMCEYYGKKLLPAHPLGYNNSQALIAFSYNTPDNTLPIIWASKNNECALYSSGKEWYPLWERRTIYESYCKPNLKNLKTITGRIKLNRLYLLESILDFVRFDNSSYLSRRTSILGKSGTGKTHFTKELILNLKDNSIVIYLDLNSDYFFVNMFYELLIYNSLKVCDNETGCKIHNGYTFIYYLLKNFPQNMDSFIKSLYKVVGLLPGMNKALNYNSLNENDKLPEAPEDASFYFFKYLQWLAVKKKTVYLIIDNYQFLSREIRTAFEQKLNTLQTNISFVSVCRLSEDETTLDHSSHCYSTQSKTILLDELTLNEIELVLTKESADYSNWAADCFLKTKGNLKEIEYYIAQLKINQQQGKIDSNIKTLVENINSLSDLDSYLMTISSLFPTGMEKKYVLYLLRIILSIDDKVFNSAIEDLIQIGYLIINGESGEVLKPAHEKIIISLSKSLSDDKFTEIHTSLLDSLESLISTMQPTTEYSYLLHCFVGIFTADQFKTKLNYIIKLLDIQYQSHKYHYLITFYKQFNQQNGWDDLFPLLPSTTINQLLDSMQKSSEFYCGLEFLKILKKSKIVEISKFNIYEIKFLTQIYHFKEALGMIKSFNETCETILYKLNILQHLGRDAEAKKIVDDLLSKESDIDYDELEYFYVILRNTAHYFNAETAEKNLLKCLNYFRRTGQTFTLATVMNNLGVLFLWCNKLETAESYLLKSEKLFSDLNSNEIFEPQCNLSILYSLREDKKMAYEYIQKAIMSFPKNLTFDYIMLTNNQQLIDMQREAISISEAYHFYQTQIATVYKYNDPWLSFIIEYNTHAIEMFLFSDSDICPDLNKYGIKFNATSNTGSIIFKDILIKEVTLTLAFALSPHWRY